MKETTSKTTNSLLFYKNEWGLEEEEWEKDSFSFCISYLTITYLKLSPLLPFKNLRYHDVIKSVDVNAFWELGSSMVCTLHAKYVLTFIEYYARYALHKLSFLYLSK